MSDPALNWKPIKILCKNSTIIRLIDEECWKRIKDPSGASSMKPVVWRHHLFYRLEMRIHVIYVCWRCGEPGRLVPTPAFSEQQFGAAATRFFRPESAQHSAQRDYAADGLCSAILATIHRITGAGFVSGWWWAPSQSHPHLPIRHDRRSRSGQIRTGGPVYDVRMHQRLLRKSQMR